MKRVICRLKIIKIFNLEIKRFKIVINILIYREKIPKQIFFHKIRTLSRPNYVFNKKYKNIRFPVKLRHVCQGRKIAPFNLHVASSRTRPLNK